MAQITVTAKVTYTYDTDDEIVTDVESAEEDVRDLLDRGEVTANDFTFHTEVTGEVTV